MDPNELANRLDALSAKLDQVLAAVSEPEDEGDADIKAALDEAEPAAAPAAPEAPAAPAEPAAPEASETPAQESAEPPVTNDEGQPVTDPNQAR